MPNTPSESSNIAENPISQIESRIKELAKSYEIYGEGSVKDLIGSLLDLYFEIRDELKNPVETIYERMLIISIMQFEIESKEGKLNHLLNSKKKHALSISTEIKLKGDETEKKNYAKAVLQVERFFGALAGYFNQCGFENKKEIFDLIIGEKFEPKKEISKVKEFMEPFDYLRDSAARFSAYEIALVLTHMNILLFRLHQMDLKHLQLELEKLGLGGKIADITSSRDNIMKDIQDRFRFDFINIDFIDMVKRFQMLIRGKIELDEKKEGIFPQDIAEKIKERIRKIEAFCGDANLFD